MTDERTTSTYYPLPADIASWLTSHNWHQISQNRQRPALWTLGNRELLQPTILDANDYDLRLSQMLRSLASCSDRSVEAIADEMNHEGSDVIEWRAKGLRDRDYSVPLEDGLTLVQSVRNAFVAATNATIQRRGYFAHSTLKAARDHARDVRMGQTRPGSYIVPIISRLPGVTEQPEEQQGRLDVEVSAQPFERRVMALLADALKAVHELAVMADHEPSPSELMSGLVRGYRTNSALRWTPCWPWSRSVMSMCPSHGHGAQPATRMSKIWSSPKSVDRGRPGTSVDRPDLAALAVLL